MIYGSGTSSGNYPTLRFNTANNQGVMIEHNEFDAELPIAGYGLVKVDDDDNTSSGTLSIFQTFAGGGNATINGVRILPLVMKDLVMD